MKDLQTAKTRLAAGDCTCVLCKDWDEKIGDRMVKLVFIGKNMNKEQIISGLDKCIK